MRDRGTDFESALVVTLFGVGYSLLVKLIQEALSFGDLVIKHFFPEFILFLILIVLFPFATILAYVYYSRKEKYSPLSARNFKYPYLEFIPAALVKIVVLDGAPYVFFVLSMTFLQSTTPDIMQARYDYGIPYSYLPLVYVVAWLVLLVIYIIIECKLGKKR